MLQKNVKNKTLLNKNLKIYREIARDSTQRSLAFYDESTRITKENKTRVFAMEQCVSFMHSPTSIYNIILFKKLTQN